MLMVGRLNDKFSNFTENKFHHYRISILLKCDMMCYKGQASGPPSTELLLDFWCSQWCWVHTHCREPVGRCSLPQSVFSKVLSKPDLSSESLENLIKMQNLSFYILGTGKQSNTLYLVFCSLVDSEHWPSLGISRLDRLHLSLPYSGKPNRQQLPSHSMKTTLNKVISLLLRPYFLISSVHVCWEPMESGMCYELQMEQRARHRFWLQEALFLLLDYLTQRPTLFF